MSSNPYAAGRRVEVREMTSELDQFLRRLRTLGATPEEIEAVRGGWDDFDDPELWDDDEAGELWTPARRAALVRAPDSLLVDMIRDVREEYAHGTTTEEEAETDDRQALTDAAFLEASGRIGGTVAAILAWVGEDPARAFVVHRMESSPEGQGRKGLMAALAPLATLWSEG